jgi:hypothetical protein
MDLKASCAVGGRPGALFLSPDGSQLYVFDQELPHVTVIGVARWKIVGQFPLASPSSGIPFFLGGFEDSIFIGGLFWKVERFDASSRSPNGFFLCKGEACDLAFLPESRQAVLTTVFGDGGFIELLALEPHQTLSRMDLPLPPVRGTLALLPQRGLGAVVLRDGLRRDEAIALFDCQPGAEPCIIPMEGGVRSVAFEPGGRFLYAACHDDSTLAVIDVREQRVVQRVLLAGEPYLVQADPAGQRMWALCEKLGHIAFIDTNDHVVIRRTQMAGLAAGRNQIAFSPEGRLAIVPEIQDGSLSLVEAGPPGARHGELHDRLELGREIGVVLWSPLGDEVYVTAPDSGALLSISVDRGDQEIKDTDLYLMEQLLRQKDPAGLKNPLFPP